MIKMLLRGTANHESTANPGSTQDSRAPITKESLTLLKHRISLLAHSVINKRMLWSACTLLFFGAFRGSELLCKRIDTFDPRFTLCSGDIALCQNKLTGKTGLRVVVKTPKEEKSGRDIHVTVCRTSSESLCPVTAWEKWQAYNPLSEAGQPVFRWEDGAPLTVNQLNKLLRAQLGANFSSHSFRIGAASAMGQLGFNDQDIQEIGRWRSSAYNSYVRLGRSRRLLVAEKFSKFF